jgi:hypothetical protein
MATALVPTIHQDITWECQTGGTTYIPNSRRSVQGLKTLLVNARRNEDEFKSHYHDILQDTERRYFIDDCAENGFGNIPVGIYRVTVLEIYRLRCINYRCEISGPHDGEYEDGCLLDYCAV